MVCWEILGGNHPAFKIVGAGTADTPHESRKNTPQALYVVSKVSYFDVGRALFRSDEKPFANGSEPLLAGSGNVYASRIGIGLRLCQPVNIVLQQVHLVLGDTNSHRHTSALSSLLPLSPKDLISHPLHQTPQPL